MCEKDLSLKAPIFFSDGFITKKEARDFHVTVTEKKFGITDGSLSQAFVKEWQDEKFICQTDRRIDEAGLLLEDDSGICGPTTLAHVLTAIFRFAPYLARHVELPDKVTLIGNVIADISNATGKDARKSIMVDDKINFLRRFSQQNDLGSAIRVHWNFSPRREALVPGINQIALISARRHSMAFVAVSGESALLFDPNFENLIPVKLKMDEYGSTQIVQKGYPDALINSVVMVTVHPMDTMTEAIHEFYRR